MSAVVYNKIAGHPDIGWTLLDQQKASIGFGPDWTGLDGENDILYKIIISGKNMGANVFEPAIQVNGDTGTNYDYLNAGWTSGGTSESGVTNDTEMVICPSLSAGQSCYIETEIQGYANANGVLISARSYTINGASSALSFNTGANTAETAAINQIKMTAGLSLGGYFDGALFQLWAARPPQ